MSSILGPTSVARGIDSVIGSSLGHMLSPVLGLWYSTVIQAQVRERNSPKENEELSSLPEILSVCSRVVSSMENLECQDMKFRL